MAKALFAVFYARAECWKVREYSWSGAAASARALGCEIQVGTDMLFEQIPAYLEFFGFRTTTPDELRAVAQINY
jgi:hypothetical protein